MKAFACCVIAMLLSACGSMSGRDQFLIAAGDKPVIYAPGHRPDKDLTVDLPLSGDDWDGRSACASFTVSDRYAFTADRSGFGRKTTRLIIKDAKGWKDHPATDRGQPWRVTARSCEVNGNNGKQCENEDPFALKLKEKLKACVGEQLLAPTMLAVLNALPRNFDEEIVHQFGVAGAGNDGSLLGAVQLRGGMQLRMTSLAPAPANRLGGVDKTGKPDTSSLPFSALSQTDFMVIERTNSGERGLELANGLGLSIQPNQATASPNFIHYVDNGWYTRDMDASASIPYLPTGVYIAYPKTNPRQSQDGVTYWDPEQSLKFSTKMVFDYTTAATDGGNKISVINLLNGLRSATSANYCKPDSVASAPIYCPRLAGGAIVVARIQVTTNAGQSWVPVGTLVADVLQEAGWSNPLAGFACPTPGAVPDSAQQKLMRAHATTLDNSSVPLPTLERRFATGLATAVPATAAALLCAPLLPGDHLSW